jgi:hypothetical protein
MYLYSRKNIRSIPELALLKCLINLIIPLTVLSYIGFSLLLFLSRGYVDTTLSFVYTLAVFLVLWIVILTCVYHDARAFFNFSRKNAFFLVLDVMGSPHLGMLPSEYIRRRTKATLDLTLKRSIEEKQAIEW